MSRLTANIIGSALVAALALGGAASAAGYLKIGDIKGEATAASDHKDWIIIESMSSPIMRQGAADSTLTITSGQDPVAIGLLLPAVQKVREAAARPQKAPMATYRKTDANGKVIKTYWLKDVVLSPTDKAGTVKLTYQCRTWRDEATKRKGTDCVSPARSKSKGKVDATWKIEEGVK